MGLGGVSIWQLLIILVIIVLMFGTKRLKDIGSDLGSAVRGFKNSMADAEKGSDDTSTTATGADAPTAVKTQPAADKDRDTAARS
ncbi:twin-arginine translocase TatA/TatE family subunit [Chromatium weissei]|nr:twin-arginine translocase TatA/TatE family subunit [Chromatium weissei]